MKILFVTSESVPFAVTGGLGDVSSALPKALRNRRQAIRVVMPLYSDIGSEYRDKMKYLCHFNVPVSWRNQYCGVFELTFDGVKYYFLDNEYYFNRKGLYGYYDDAERYSFFSRAVLEMLNNIDFEPEIIHVNDWQSSLVNVYLDLYYRHIPRFYPIKTLLTIHNIQYQGKYGMEIAEDVLGIGKADYSTIEYNGNCNFLKGAIATSDRVNTVSPTYSSEILDPWFSHGLSDLLSSYKYKLRGILNGIDTVLYDPSKDDIIAANFSHSDFSNKALCKDDLLKEFGMVDNGEPVIGIVSRLVAHKGFDLIKHVLEYILLAGMKVVVLGTGEYIYESFFSDYSARYPGQLGVRIDFNSTLARKIYAGSDMYLMPSKSEPCGLAQMISLRYGTIPIVRETGGLKDSVFDSGDGKGNGFTFKTYNAHDMLDACFRAKNLYYDKESWNQLIKRAMLCDNSWKKSANDYLKLYEEMLTLWE